ncbi:MAG: class A beta-lactamase, partial [Candidatus Sericytochromatia bacterium]
MLAAAVFLLIDAQGWAAGPRGGATVHDRLAALERSVGGRLGVAAFSGARTLASHRADERFPFCSTFKLPLVAAILHRSATDKGLLDRRVPYTKGQLVPHSPITERHVGAGMTVSELCAAALQHSDNTASNLLTARLGGPGAVTAYARSIGDTRFRLDRWEPALNSALPGDARDTTTPGAMARSLARLTLGDALAPPGRLQLADWLRGNTTGATRIRAGIPASWPLGDKTGTGIYGTTNDIAVIWPPNRPPLV